MKRTEYRTHSSEETKRIAEELARTFQGGEVILSEGPLGAGKTAFCQGIGRALGVKKIINSPTFNLIKIYGGTKYQLYHVDCYRLENCEEEKKDIGLDEVLGDKDTITYVEWPIYGDKNLLDYHPIIHVELEYISDEERRIVIEDERF